MSEPARDLPAEAAEALDLKLDLGHPWYRTDNLTNYERFAEWAEATYPELPLLTRAERADLPGDLQARYDECRLWHNLHLRQVDTPLITRVRAEMDQRLAYNAGVEDGRKHLILDGEGGLGKSTAARDYARKAFHDLSSAGEGGPTVPVVWVQVPATQGIEPLIDAISRYVGWVFGRGTVGRKAGLLADFLVRCGTELVVLDDGHRLHEQRRSKEPTINFLKWFSDAGRVGYLMTAVDLRSKGWFQESRNDTQWWERVAVIDVHRNFGTDEMDASLWKGLILELEERLLLLDHTPGTLASATMAKYLYKRAEGRIGRLAELLGYASRTAMNDGTEKITKALLEQTTTSGTAQLFKPSPPSERAP